MILLGGRTGPENAKDAGLKERVAKLESLLADWQSYGDPLAAQSARLRQKASPVKVYKHYLPLITFCRHRQSLSRMIKV